MALKINIPYCIKNHAEKPMYIIIFIFNYLNTCHNISIINFIFLRDNLRLNSSREFIYDDDYIRTGCFVDERLRGKKIRGSKKVR